MKNLLLFLLLPVFCNAQIHFDKDSLVTDKRLQSHKDLLLYSVGSKDSIPEWMRVKECNHIYIAIQDSVIIQKAFSTLSTYSGHNANLIAGSEPQEYETGVELICIKCNKRIKQKMKYQ